jgi:hypothetical protein
MDFHVATITPFYGSSSVPGASGMKVPEGCNPDTDGYDPN